jgi:hypothetical protein
MTGAKKMKKPTANRLRALAAARNPAVERAELEKNRALLQNAKKKVGTPELPLN